MSWGNVGSLVVYMNDSPSSPPSQPSPTQASPGSVPLLGPWSTRSDAGRHHDAWQHRARAGKGSEAGCCWWWWIWRGVGPRHWHGRPPLIARSQPAAPSSLDSLALPQIPRPLPFSHVLYYCLAFLSYRNTKPFESEGGREPKNQFEVPGNFRKLAHSSCMPVCGGRGWAGFG